MCKVENVMRKLRFDLLKPIDKAVYSCYNIEAVIGRMIYEFD